MMVKLILMVSKLCPFHVEFVTAMSKKVMSSVPKDKLKWAFRKFEAHAQRESNVPKVDLKGFVCIWISFRISSR
jgi:hypothetical protein